MAKPDQTVYEWESPDYEPSLPVSEKSNPLTRDIDRSSTIHIVRMLQACDSQMFQEETGETYQRLLGKEVVKTLVEVAKRVELVLKDPQDSLVVLSGCGTSGRMAFFITSAFNRVLRQLNRSLVYSYIIAGGDRALFSSQEAPEDDARLGMLSLKKACEGKRRVLFIGISCGLSAPFVAGQLDFCLQQPEVYTPVLVGFNPSHQARDEPIPGCTFTFHSVVQRMEELAGDQKAFLINPAVGPEAIAGSSRMKGGSATKIILEVILSAAHTATFANTPVTDEGVQQHMRAYRRSLDATYAQTEGMAALLEAAGRSLRRGGRVCYLGWGSVAVIGLIDASECNPTFGADHDDVRGFISGGYRELSNNEGPLSLLGPDFCISHEDFVRQFLPSLSDRDAVLLLYTHADDLSEVAALARRVRGKACSLHAVYHKTDGDAAATAQQEVIDELCSSSLKITWPASESFLLMQCELSTKLLLNAVSTGAHVLKGKIYRNHMIDVQVTNSKLYCRAMRLLQVKVQIHNLCSCSVLESVKERRPKLSGRPEPQCAEALLKALYRLDELTADITSSDVSAHARAARHRTKVVPLALVCLLADRSLAEAESHLEQQPIVREAVEACLS